MERSWSWSGVIFRLFGKKEKNIWNSMAVSIPGI
jgi:hypothetical protein